MVSARLTAMGVENMLKGKGMVCDMIRPEGMNRPEGTAMQTKPGTGIICDMIRLEGMSRPEGTALQTKSRKAMSRLDIDDEVVSAGTAPLLPPSAPERTSQASGQGQASARPKGGPPCCSVPVPSTLGSARASFSSRPRAL
jgi:hypothetical protein